MSDLRAGLAELSTAEDFLDFFEVPYDRRVVEVNRLHILKRLHDYLAAEPLDDLDDAALTEAYRRLLACAYADFAASDALTERVFKVLRDAREPKPDGPPRGAFVALGAVHGRPGR